MWVTGADGRQQCDRGVQEVGEKQEKTSLTGPLKPTRRPNSQASPQDQGQIETCNVNQQPFRDVLSTSQVDPAHTAGVVAVGETSFEDLATAAQQALAALAANPSPAGVGGAPLCGLATPVSATAAAR